MKMILNIIISLSFTFGAITLLSVVAYGGLEYFGLLFVDKFNIANMMEQLLKVSYICFAIAVVLSLEQYLKVYYASAKDGYRITVREKKDNDKIVFIEKHLKAKGMK